MPDGDTDLLVIGINLEIIKGTILLGKERKMHALARSNLQHFIISYKEPSTVLDERKALKLEKNFDSFSNIFDGRECHRQMKALIENDGRKKLEQAKKKSVSFAVRTLLPYNGCLDNDIPVPGKAVSFQVGQFLHIYEKFNNDWWIGRLVIDGSLMGFIPTPTKFQQIRTHRFKILQRGLKKSNSSSSMETTTGKGGQILYNQSMYYDVVPPMRPVCFIGPSLKGYYVTDFLQKGIFDCLKDSFKDRVNVCKMNDDAISNIGNKFHSTDLNESFYMEAEKIFKESNKMNLVLLENGNIDNPAHLKNSFLAPIIIYIRIENLKVLRKLIKSNDKCTVHEVKAQLAYAESLLRLGDDVFDLVLKENELPKVVKEIILFLETYWRATHPNWKEIEKNSFNASKSKISFSEPY
ncbi:Calcium channel, voltage-dependent, beta 2b [Strongyloides ratti]|uniref:Calcium channel, voltage-dependent, beta 2b n=1 Tax=Strongyloides ratti TaxID=34506 RepID=A0A090L8V7_STRRB|nr:Calcium channel, voltage-dependent, beta 2b [Strongyloides ratti]CEF66167.1 Calcium channel, voltage-dependent, beta 2b [Strongyloides ratti]